jgi:hypothetical protein
MLSCIRDKMLTQLNLNIEQDTSNIRDNMLSQLNLNIEQDTSNIRDKMLNQLNLNIEQDNMNIEQDNMNIEQDNMNIEQDMNIDQYVNIKQDTNSKIYIFYHIYCNQYTLEVLKDQMIKIIYSGLYKTCNNIYYFLTGDNIYINICDNYIKRCGKKFIIGGVGVNDKSYERFTLLKIKKYINANDKFLYIHSKGVTKQNNQYVTDWRNVMEYFLIYNYKNCLKELDEYDTVGINHYGNHYSGNFWWTKGSYYLKLSNQIEKYYTAPENYICTKKPKYKNLYSTKLEGSGHYRNLYSIDNYIDTTI